ncbi:MAG: hypothetical protein U5Q44_07595 [Dehalococcoidia bacterium]|nr:hypothetical protein [Dehalococcoidia bacterium]
MRRMRRRQFLNYSGAGAAGVAAMGLVGCGGDDDDDANGGGGGGETPDEGGGDPTATPQSGDYELAAAADPAHAVLLRPAAARSGPHLRHRAGEHRYRRLQRPDEVQHRDRARG